MMLLAVDFSNLHEILRNLYQEMMPLCANMAGVAKGIAGLGALVYVAVRVWQALARADPSTCIRCSDLSPSVSVSCSFPRWYSVRSIPS